MRLADFILKNMNPILTEWDVFAREIWPEADASQSSLRDHAEEVLRAAVHDMQTSQSTTQQQDKSQGQGDAGTSSKVLDKASIVHAQSRVDSGFSLPAVVAEYRALRATVVRLWGASGHTPDARDLVDLTRFNETIDQSLSEAVRGYTLHVDDARQMFLAILGHDLRNPLNAILVSADVLTELPASGPESAEAVAQISASSLTMARMLGDFLDFAQTQLGQRMPVARKLTDLARLCAEVVAETKAAHPGQKVRYAAKGNTMGEWDPARLRQVFSNLVGNAVQHGATDRPIDVEVKAGPADVEVTVTNEGPTIPPDIMSRIFQPMVRGHSAESRTAQRLGSMGLGLYIAREVVTAHGGSIDVTSTPAGITTFTVRLPRSTPSDSTTKDTTPTKG